MNMKSNHSSPVLTDPIPVSKSRVGIHSNLLSYPQSGGSLYSGKYKMIPTKKPAKLDDVRSNGWMDAMKSLSPPRKKIIKGFNIEFVADDVDTAYNSWSIKYPSALKSFEKISKRTKNKKIAVFLEVSLFNPAREFVPMIDEIFKTLVENTNDIKGAKVENHEFCASVHYRNVEEKNWPTIAQCVHDTLKDYPRLRLTHGRKVLEIRPVIDWNKGKAIAIQILILNMGIQVLREGDRGCGILVSSVPKESNAIFSVRDPSEVENFLKELVKKLKKQRAQ